MYQGALRGDGKIRHATPRAGDAHDNPVPLGDITIHHIVAPTNGFWPAPELLPGLTPMVLA